MGGQGRVGSLPPCCAGCAVVWSASARLVADASACTQLATCRASDGARAAQLVGGERAHSNTTHMRYSTPAGQGAKHTQHTQHTNQNSNTRPMPHLTQVPRDGAVRHARDCTHAHTKCGIEVNGRLHCCVIWCQRRWACTCVVASGARPSMDMARRTRGASPSAGAHVARIYDPHAP